MARIFDTRSARPSWSELEILRTQDDHGRKLSETQVQLSEILKQLNQIQKGVDKIMATQEDAAAELATIKDQLVKANTEIQAKIQALVEAANNADNVNPALQQAIDDLKPAAQALDDVVPDQS